MLAGDASGNDLSAIKSLLIDTLFGPSAGCANGSAWVRDAVLGKELRGACWQSRYKVLPCTCCWWFISAW